jgi:Tripartite tricarboxylate transporter TctB family.
MPSIDYRDAVGGALLVAVGAAFAIYSWTHYPLGTVSRMGAGMVPFSLGVILSIFGGMVAMASLSREGSFTDIRVATPLIVLGSVVLFALAIIPFGFLPAAFLVTLVAAFADLSFRPIRNIVLATVLSAAAYLIFAIGLQLPIPLFAWPF